MSRCVGLFLRGTEDNGGCHRVGYSARQSGNKDWRSWKDRVCRTARHNEIARVETRKDFVMLIPVSCGNGHWNRWRTESYYAQKGDMCRGCPKSPIVNAHAWLDSA